MTKRGETDAEVESLAMIEMISKAYSGGRNATGVIRWYWPRLKPLLDANYLGITDLARNTGIDPSTLRGAVARVRHEETGAAQPRSSRPDTPAHDARLTGAEPKDESDHSTERASSTSEGKPKRVGNLIIKDQPKHQPAEVPDEDGFITLDNGVRYRRHPRNPKFFEVHPPGDSKPFTTHRKPLPTDRVDP